MSIYENAPDPVAVRPVPEGRTLVDPRVCRLTLAQTALWEYVHNGLTWVSVQMKRDYSKAKRKYPKLSGIALIEALEKLPLPTRRGRFELISLVMDDTYGLAHHPEFYMAVRACPLLYGFEQEWLIEEVRRSIEEPTGKLKDKYKAYDALRAKWLHEG